MTIQGILKNLSAEDLELTKQYYKSIQPFAVQPSDTCEFDAEFPAEDGERIIAEITLDENAEIEDLYCTCRAGVCRSKMPKEAISQEKYKSDIFFLT